MKGILTKICALSILLFCQINFAQTGLLFKVNVELATLKIITVTPKNYSHAGIKVNTAGYRLSNPGKDCQVAPNGYCLFAVSKSTPAIITIKGPAGEVDITLCLDGNGPLSCQRYTIALSQELIPPVEGSFEKPTFADNGWYVAVERDSSGNFFIYDKSETNAPLSDQPILSPPPCGAKAAISDQIGPGSYALYRDIHLSTLPQNYKYTLSFQVAVHNFNGSYITPGTLSYTPIPNQQARVDILKPGDPFTMNPNDIFLTAFKTNPGDPLIIPYKTITVDLPRDLINENIRLRFAEVDNQFFQNFYVDCVSLIAHPVTK